MKHLTKTIITLAAVICVAPQLHAQSLPVGSHYPIGAEGLNGAELPPPGFYVRDYNYFYTSDSVDGLPANVDTFVFVNAVKLIYLTDYKILGADWGVDSIVPFMYKNFSGQLGTAGQLNLGDIYLAPVLLSWHLKQFDFAAAYGVWAPVGNYEPGTAAAPLRGLDSPGNGYWTHMFTFGGVWHPDEQKLWSLSLLNRYEINTEQDQTQITPGNMYSLEWGLGRSVAKGVDVGLVGYYQQEVTQDDGPHAATALSHVVAIGPEVSVVWEKIDLISTLRYEYEVNAKDRPQGQAVVLTLTRRF
jgi:hypothetical protein